LDPQSSSSSSSSSPSSDDDDNNNNNNGGVPNINTVVNCLREVAADDLTLHQWDIVLNAIGTAFPPTTDTLHFLADSPHTLVLRGQFKQTSLMMGSNLHEGSFFMLYGMMDYFPKDREPSVSLEQYFESLATFIPETGDNGVIRDVIDFEYNGVDRALDPSKTLTRLTSDITGDYWFICPVNDFAQAYADFGMDVYMYRFLHRTESNPWPDWMGVIHGYEIDYFFGDAQNGSLAYTEEERKLSRKMMKYLVNFAKRGRPTNAEESWPPYSPIKREYKIFDISENDADIGSAPRFRHCSMWSRLLPKLRRMTGPGAHCSVTDSAAEIHLSFVKTLSLLSISFLVTRIFLLG